MIFSAPKIQWVQVFERLDLSAKNNEDDLSETIELLLLGRISSKWTSLIEHLMSVCYDSLTISTVYNEVRNLMLGRFQNLQFKEEMLNSEANVKVCTLLGMQNMLKLMGIEGLFIEVFILWS